MLREKIYELKNWKLAVHTTWNPGAENVMRIHLVPPRFLSGKNSAFCCDIEWAGNRTGQ